MSLRRRVMVIASMVLAVVFAMNFLFAVAAQRHSLNAAKENELANVAKITTSALQDRELISAGAAEIIADQPWVAKAFRAGDRSALQQGLQPMFERMKAVYGATIIQFFTPPAQALLFVENPAMPITDFSDTRPMIIAANLHGTSQRGLELGPVGLAVRAVAPIKDDAGLIGVVEYASDFQALLKQIGTLTDTQLATLINEDLWNKARKNDKEFMPARDQLIDGSRTVYSTDWDVTSALVTAEELAPTRGNRTTTRTRGGIEYGVLTMPLMDFSGQQIGFVIATRSFAALNAEFVDAVRLAVLRMLLGFIVSFGAVVVIFNGLLLRPVTDLLGKLQALENGEDNTPLAIPGRTDEVGKLFGVADRLRLKLRAKEP